ncbi:DNA polymerase IV [Suttonella sp. R2A3]|uniref:DNA polymerase IV n=1 Tax=Suttonella sp. R2A3 TaxID=2908648 RepID=UPI001F35E314|nr:DNA polymerase IV [Suttonella sp. R2A3]UJF24913.1 DNA polymerase IV [Suttonella sp. R2A3]
MRKIIHIDMDAFFASVEQLDTPQYRGRPLVVGGLPNTRGVIAAASYEARRFGIHSAMSSAEAQRRCADLIFVRPRFARYRALSQEIRELMLAITPHVEPLSLDEAYLEVTDCTLFQGSATRIANHLRRQIFEQTGLTASAGVSFNKMLAKIASDLNKPNGIAVITPQEADAFIASLPIGRFHGIGKATAAHMARLNIHTGADLRAADPKMLVKEFGKRGAFYAAIAHGEDHREVSAKREHKSVGSETTFARNLTQREDIFTALLTQNEQAFSDLARHNLMAHCVTIKIKYHDFSQITRSKTLSSTFHCASDSHYWLDRLLDDVPLDKPIRLVGVTFSRLTAKQPNKQMSLW